MSGVASRIPGYIDIGIIYELGRDSHKFNIDHSYPAVEITSLDGIEVAHYYLDDPDGNWPYVLTRHSGYYDSVVTGIRELKSILQIRSDMCPDELFILGGFSQGAHVMSKALSGFTYERLVSAHQLEVPVAIRDRIAFVALFGDPSLHLPNGIETYTRYETVPSYWYPFYRTVAVTEPVACRGLSFDIEKYRRGSFGCHATGGVLRGFENRDRYIAGDLLEGGRGFPWHSGASRLRVG